MEDRAFADTKSNGGFKSPATVDMLDMGCKAAGRYAREGGWNAERVMATQDTGGGFGATTSGPLVAVDDTPASVRAVTETKAVTPPKRHGPLKAAASNANSAEEFEALLAERGGGTIKGAPPVAHRLERDDEGESVKAGRRSSNPGCDPM